MSAIARAPGPDAGSLHPGGARAPREPGRSRPLVRLSAYSALALYGALRWSGLSAPASTWRLVGLAGLSALAAGGLGALAQRGKRARLAAALGALALLPAVLALAGVPLALILHGRVRLIASEIGLGLSALPRATVPYRGIDEGVRTVILLGAGVLLLVAGLVHAMAGSRLGDARRSAVALPLLAVAVVPSVLIHPAGAPLHGLLLLGLLAALVWGERIGGRRLGPAILLTGLAGLGAVALAPALETHRPWISPQSLAGALASPNLESFDWSQRYGPLQWPRSGREMLDVHARHGDYWKAENLDVFDGTRWLQGAAETGALLPAPGPAESARFTQTLRITIRAMRTTDVIAAGFAGQPQRLPAAAQTGVSPGTWSAVAELGPGDSYLVPSYSPRPSRSALRKAGRGYPDALLAGYRSMTLPAPPNRQLAPAEVVFPPFRPSLRVDTAPVLDAGAAAAIAASPYAGAYAIARRLARGTGSAYALVERVLRQLARGFTYGENPPVRPYPLESFLLRDRLGYCQQFAGAMALLLRMDGLPARVAAGFTSGSYDASTRQWVVSDLDAHAWVEVWFPRYGWVRFDPTPAAAPALGGRESGSALSAPAGRRAGRAPPAQRRLEPGRSASSRGRRPDAGSPLLPALALVFAIVGGALGLRAASRGGRPGKQEPIGELELAFARCRRPLGAGTTLAQLERRLRTSPAAAGYVRELREARFGVREASAAPAGRAALRARLAEGLGPAGWLRALLALPPRRARPAAVHRRRAGSGRAL